MAGTDAARDEAWMDQALDWAEQAGQAGEVPVGAVLVRDGACLAGAGNAPIGRTDPTAHAEIIVLREAADRTGNYRLGGTTLYVTLEPCVMCLGALMLARIGRLVYAAADPRFGAIERLSPGQLGWIFNHHLEITGGVRAEPAGRLLQEFFAIRRSGRSMLEPGGKPEK
jgi:tRNA(adenine34) deaminase